MPVLTRLLGREQKAVGRLIAAEKAKLFAKGLRQHDQPIGVAFALVDANGFAIKVDITDSQAAEFAVAEPGGVHNSNGKLAGYGGRSGEDASDFGG